MSELIDKMRSGEPGTVVEQLDHDATWDTESLQTVTAALANAMDRIGVLELEVKALARALGAVAGGEDQG